MRNKFSLYIIILLSLLIRVYNIQQPILEGAAGAQIDRATVVRNLYLDGEILFPKGDFLPGPNLRMLEFPLYHFLVAWGYRIVGGVHEWVGRLISILSFCFSIFFLYSIVKECLNERAGIIASIFYGLSPLTIIYSRSIQSDTLMLSLSIITVFLFSKYLEKQSLYYYFLATVSTAALFLIKIPMLVIILPLLALVYFKSGSKLWLNWKICLFGIITLVPSIFWYLYASESMNNPLINRILTDDWEIANRFDLWRLLDYNFYKTNFENMIGIDLTPIGFTLMILGLFLKRNKQKEMVFDCWLVSIIIMFFIMPGHSTESYYHLPFIPPACFFIGKAVNAILENEKVKDCLWNNHVKRIALFLLLGLIVFGYSNSGYRIPQDVSHCKDAGLAVKNISKNSDTVIVWESHQAVLYYSGRKGWVLKQGNKDIARYFKYYNVENIPADPTEFLNFLIRLGAKYFVTTNPHRLVEEQKLYKYLKGHFQLVEKNDNYLIFKL